MTGQLSPPPAGVWARRYAAFEEFVSGVCLGLSLTLILYGVVMRYVFESPLLYWVDEISTYLAVWGAIFGWSVAERDHRHIRVTLLVDRLPPRAQYGAAVVTTVISALFCLILAYMGIEMERRYIESGQLTLNTQSPLWAIYSAVPVAALMLGGRYIAALLDLLRNGRVAPSETLAPAPESAGW